jgi:pterin-4a-carbinolamine dehydratase
MSDTLPIPEGWRLVARPPSVFRRFQFDAYAQTRTFLDRLASLSESTGLYPDLGFGPTYVNVTIHGQGGVMPGEPELAFASRATELAQGLPPS